MQAYLGSSHGLAGWCGESWQRVLTFEWYIVGQFNFREVVFTHTLYMHNGFREGEGEKGLMEPYKTDIMASLDFVGQCNDLDFIFEHSLKTSVIS